MAALAGAIALTKVNGIAVLIRNDLDFNMPGVFEIFLQVNRGIAESTAGFLPGQLQGIVQMGLGVHHAHATSTTAGRRLDDDRVTHFAGYTCAFNRVVCQRTV